MATKDFIGYQALIDAALVGVVRSALTHAAKGGIMGAHHFYITFDTRAPGVELTDVMRERFPDFITIVLQNQYWNLKLHDDRFEVGLSFNKVPETVVVPYSAIREFRDPSQSIGFRIQGDGEAAPRPRPQAAPKPESLPAPAEATAKPSEEPPAEPPSDKPTVVSLDKFRKK